MPDVIAPPAPPDAPAPSGIDSFMEDVMTGIEAPAAPPPPPPNHAVEPPKEPPTPPATPAKVTAAKVEPKTAPKSPEAPATPPKPKEDMNQLRRRHDELLAGDKKSKAEIVKLQEENKALAGKRYVTPEMEKEIEENQTEIKRLKSEIEEAAYERSEPFKKEYVARYQRVQEGALAMVQHFPVSVKRVDENGETQTSNRASTPGDYWKVRNADPGERAQVARELFGDNALTLLTHIFELDRIKSDADTAVKQRGEESATKVRQTETKNREDQRKFMDLRESARKQLVDKYPQFFGADEADPAANEALAKGFEFFDNATNSNGLSPDEQAAYAEVIRARAAWFPRGFRENSALRTENASLKEELEKIRGTDPGAEKEKGNVEQLKDEFGVDGIDGLADKIEKEMAG